MYASVHDAALVVGTAIQNLMNSDEGKETIDSHFTNSNCPLRSTSTHQWGLGWKLLQQIRKVKFQGLTGEVQFNLVTGERRVHNGLDIVNVLRNNVKKIGSWQPEPGMKDHRVSFKQRTPQEPPFVEKVNESVPLPASGRIPKQLLRGFCIDLIEELSKEANFKYEIYLHTEYGGMVDELTKKAKDIALAPITITADRELVIDFSKPFMDFSMSLIMHKPGDPPINIFAFLLPFTGGVWLSTVGVVLFITAMMCMMDHLSPFGNRARARESEDEPGNEFNLLNSLWFATASVLQQGPDNTPLSPSGRLLASAFWFFILILISTYTANLAAFFTIKRTVETINSLEELESQKETKYGVLNTGSVKKFFENSEDPLHLGMFSHMREYHTFVNTTSEGVKKARNENYAYITEKPYLEYYNQQKPCNTRLLNNLLQAKGYGIGLQKNSPYTNKISVAILALRERTFIEKTRRKWWDERSQCPKPSQSKTGTTQSLDVDNMAGVFLVLLSGVIVSLVLVVIEIRCKKLVMYFTSGQNDFKRRMSKSCEPRGESSLPQITPIRVAVVLSQGDKVLRQAVEDKYRGSAWNKILGKD
ncbi:hypothetical protein OS493_000891 [Desmophyllum pertusum]|uniref:Uncharacterized protein n=1 Tax=Desmophyllum pertusum TaxID=174260 RepID=A0A9W9ZU74_9CNID|nr:hypothetical protein OS493_000891 [Desmophyllum pertusum]